MDAITVNEVFTRRINHFIQCFEAKNESNNENNIITYICCIEECGKKYTQKTAAIRHVRVNHQNIFEAINRVKQNTYERAPNDNLKLEIRVQMNPEEILDACVELIAMHSLPISFVEYPAFKKILQPYIIGLKNRGINLTVNRSIVLKRMAAKADTVKQMITSEVKHKMLTVMLDIASRYNRAVLGVNIRFISRGKPYIRTIGMHVLRFAHTSALIKDIVRQNLSDFGISLNQLLAGTTHNGRNVIKATALLDECFQDERDLDNVPSDDSDDDDYINPDIFDEEYYRNLLKDVNDGLAADIHSSLIQGISCGAHCLHLVVTHGIDDCEGASATIEKCRDLVKKLRTPTYRAKLHESHSNMALLDVETRWNSIFTMMERLLTLKPFCDSLQNDNSLKKYLLSDTDWQTVKNIVATLQPFNKYTKKVQSDEATLSDFFAYWTMLRIKVSKTANSNPLASCLLDQMNKYHQTLMDNPLIFAAMYLDPSNQRGLMDKKSLAIDFLCNLHTKIKEIEGSPAEQEAVQSDCDKSNSFEALEEYLQLCAASEGSMGMPALHSDESSIDIRTKLQNLYGIKNTPNKSTLEFWEDHKNDMPELYKLAMAVFGVPPSQASVERAFSALALVVTSRRTRLGNDTLKNILLIRLNR